MTAIRSQSQPDQTRSWKLNNSAASWNLIQSSQRRKQGVFSKAKIPFQFKTNAFAAPELLDLEPTSKSSLRARTTPSRPPEPTSSPQPSKATKTNTTATAASTTQDRKRWPWQTRGIPMTSSERPFLVPTTDTRALPAGIPGTRTAPEMWRPRAEASTSWRQIPRRRRRRWRWPLPVSATQGRPVFSAAKLQVSWCDVRSYSPVNIKLNKLFLISYRDPGPHCGLS